MSGKKALIVDSNNAVAEVLRVVLQDEGLEVTVAADARSALVAAAQQQPAFVYLDYVDYLMETSEETRQLVGGCAEPI